MAAEKEKINIEAIFKALWKKRKTFLCVWIITFILSCIWIFPQPRYYESEVSIAPESADGNAGGGLASLASNFGVNLGGLESSDAIYPELYPDLFKSNEFLVELLDIKVTTKDQALTTDYYDYLKNHKKENPYTYPLRWAKREIAKLKGKKEAPIEGKDGKRFNPFWLTKDVDNIVQDVTHNVKCNYSKTTGVVSISVKDQDPLICALLADSIKERLQTFITDYRTKKARIDYEHYKELTLDAKAQYEKVRQKYISFSDNNIEVSLPSIKAKQEDMENEMQIKYNLYTAMNTRLEAALAKVQEKTPAFTTLKCATVPVKPAGPKRMIFVAVMLIMSTFATAGWLYRKELAEWF